MSDKVQKIREEIERQIEKGKVKCQQSQENNDYESFIAWSEHVATCGKLLVFINSLPEEPASKDLELEEEITRYYKSLGIIENAGEIYEWDDMIANTILTARHFAEWQKKKMMKDAIDATILDIDAQTIELGLWPEKLLDNIKEGDRVKIIIIKEN